MPNPRRRRRGQGDTLAEEHSGPFTLVLYSEDKSLGVVETADLDLSNGIGGTCDAPDPYDWPEESKTDVKSKATIIAFGHSVNFLYNIRVNVETGEQIVPENETGLVSAKRRKKEAEKRKEDNVHNLNTAAASLSNIFSTSGIANGGNDDTSGTNNTTPSDQNTEQECILAGLIKSAPARQKNVLRKTLLFALAHVPDFSNEEAEQEDDMDDSANDLVGEAVAFATQVMLAEQEHTCSPMTSTSAPTTSHIVTPNLLSPATQAPTLAPSPSNTPFPLYFADVRGLNAQRVDPPLPCYESGPEKTKLMDYCPIYVLKHEKLGLPWILPRENETTKKGQRRPKIDGAVFPKEMVSILLKLLVPWEILKHLTATTLPLRLYNTIKAYINARLPCNQKMNQPQFNIFVTEAIRDIKKCVKNFQAKANNS